VPTTQRGRKIGGALAKSFLEYAPKLGYRGSVFNLVFKSRSSITGVRSFQTTSHHCDYGITLGSLESESFPVLDDLGAVLTVKKSMLMRLSFTNHSSSPIGRVQAYAYNSDSE
jgi:hypothetical protein